MLVIRRYAVVLQQTLHHYGLEIHILLGTLIRELKDF